MSGPMTRLSRRLAGRRPQSGPFSPSCLFGGCDRERQIGIDFAPDAVLPLLTFVSLRRSSRPAPPCLQACSPRLRPHQSRWGRVTSAAAKQQRCRSAAVRQFSLSRRGAHRATQVCPAVPPSHGGTRPLSPPPGRSESSTNSPHVTWGVGQLRAAGYAPEFLAGFADSDI
jgi:hypothetical protein